MIEEYYNAYIVSRYVVDRAEVKVTPTTTLIAIINQRPDLINLPEETVVTFTDHGETAICKLVGLEDIEYQFCFVKGEFQSIQDCIYSIMKQYNLFECKNKMCEKQQDGTCLQCPPTVM